MGATNSVPGGPNISVFNVIDGAIANLETPGQPTATIVTQLHGSLRDMDLAMSNLSGWRARSGEALSRADSMEERLGQVRLGAQKDRSDAEDLDMVKSISEFQSNQTGYQAALQTYSMVQRLSMFDYIGR
jgi:flagellar hook-associated protein 3 FlgL